MVKSAVKAVSEIGKDFVFAPFQPMIQPIIHEVLKEHQKDKSPSCMVFPTQGQIDYGQALNRPDHPPESSVISRTSFPFSRTAFASFRFPFTNTISFNSAGMARSAIRLRIVKPADTSQSFSSTYLRMIPAGTTRISIGCVPSALNHFP